MKSRTKIVGIVISAIAAISVAALMAWLFSLEGTKGLAQWGWSKVFIAIGALGILPLALCLAGLSRPRMEASKASALLLVSATAIASLSIIVSLGLFGFIWTKAHSAAPSIPAMGLVDPGKAIAIADSSGGAGGTLHIALSSDPHWSADTSNGPARLAILKGVAADKPARDAFFILGDNVQTGMNLAGWEAEANDIASNLPSTPVRALLGNHDAIIDGQVHYARYFFPKGFTSDSGSPYWYSIDAGPARIIVLDLLWGADSFGSAQRAWLERTLSAVPADRRVIVLSHCFFASSGYMDGTQPWFDHYGTLAEVAPILERHRVDLVVSGHNHYMEFLDRNGVNYATIGTMGGIPDPVPTHVSPFSKWFARGLYGWLDLDVTAKGTALSFKDHTGKTVHTEYVAAKR